MSRNFDILHQEATGAPFNTGVLPVRKDDRKEHQRDGYAVEEQILRLVQRVFILPRTKQPSFVAVCGVEHGNGCSWVCARAAEMLAAQVPGRVCVIDANLRSPSLHKRFDAEMEVGFADAMKSSAPINEFVKPTWTSHLWLMTAGTAGIEWNSALNPAQLRARFAELHSEFDYLVMDTPPISAFAEAVLLGQLTDGVVLVVGSNSTRREPARIAKENLEAARVVVLGAVLNKRTFPIPDALYRRI